MPVTVQAWSAAWQAIRTAAAERLGGYLRAVGTLWQGTLAPMGLWLVQTFAPEVIDSFSRAFAPIAQGAVPAALQAFTTLFTAACGGIQSLVRTVLAPAFALVLQILAGHDGRHPGRLGRLGTAHPGGVCSGGTESGGVVQQYLVHGAAADPAAAAGG